MRKIQTQQVKELDLNTCLVLAINNVCGVPLIKNLEQALRAFYMLNGTNCKKEFLRFIIDKGFRIILDKGFIPFRDYDNNLGLLGLN